MPIIVQFEGLALFVEGDEEKLKEWDEYFALKDFAHKFVLMRTTSKKDVLVNIDRILFLDHITQEAFDRLNEESKKMRETRKISSLEGVVPPFRFPRGN